MSRFDELDLLEQAQADAEQVADEMGFTNDVDRRKFVFMSLATAAATTFGFGAKAIAQGRGGGGGGGGRGAEQGPSVPLDNMEEVSWTFMPYPGGTGALLEKTYRDKGPAAFNRQPFTYSTATKGSFNIAPWTGNLPSTDEEIAFLPAHRISAAIKAGKLTSMRITQIYLDRLKRLNPTLMCAVTIMEEQGLADAAKMDAELKAGKYRGPLHGVPWGVKDLFAVKGTPTTWGAADFENRVFDFDAEVVKRIRDGGGVLIAKLATGQFAQGANWFRGQTKNPWNTSQASGGSSAGPGSATGGGCVAFGIGTETSGSIVGPATTCGIAALRPTFGRVSRAGGMVLAWSQDRVGPLTRTAEDAAMVFNVIHGASDTDNGSITMPFHFDPNIDFASLRLGVRKQQNDDPNFNAFIDKLKSLGAKPREIGEPPQVAGSRGGLDEESAAAFDSYVQMKAKELNIGMDSVLTAYGRTAARGGGGGGAPPGGAPGAGRGAEGTGRGPGSGQLNRWVPGRTPTAMDFINSQRRRQMLITAWQGYLKDIDLYVGAADTGIHAQTGHPVTVVQMAFGMRQAGFGGGGGGGRGRGADSTRPAAPPIALNPQPICTQIAGNLYNDDIILSFAHKFQTNTDFHTHRPKLG
ncbi:MAG TPA: amidase [Gemmatimonadaceae bacterium]|jgi:Asp-tRNA(Asn)/Glu-tRNA(Gln) amidotransferase A subunit family amidase